MRKPMLEILQPRFMDALRRAERAGAAAKLSFSHSESISCGFEAGRLKETDATEHLAYGVEVILGGKCASASGNMLDKMDDIVDRALELLPVGSKAHFHEYPPPAPLEPVLTHSARTTALTREQLIEQCDVMVRRIRDYDPDVWTGAGANRSEYEGLLVTSGGVENAVTGSSWSMGLHCQRTQDTDMLFAGHGRSWGEVNEFYDADDIAERVLWELREGAEIAALSDNGGMPVYLPPEALARFLSALMLGVNGRSVAKGDSPLQGRLGEQVLDPALTIIDNPHRHFSPGAAQLDGDGVPTRKQTIFDRGRLRTFLYDLDSAGLAGAEPTGNSGCSPYDLEVLPGSQSSHDLLGGIADGLYVKSLIGFGQSNLINGDFSANVALGFRISNGKIAGRVKNVMIAGNLYDIFREGVELSSDRDPRYLFPHAVVNGIAVSH